MSQQKNENYNSSNNNNNNNNNPTTITGGSNSTSETILQIQQSQAIRSNIQNLSQLLNTGLSPETLDICIKLCEAGIHPQALAEVVKQIRNEVAIIEKDD